jgi:hypothetical protein
MPKTPCHEETRRVQLCQPPASAITRPPISDHSTVLYATKSIETRERQLYAALCQSNERRAPCHVCRTRSIHHKGANAQSRPHTIELTLPSSSRGRFFGASSVSAAAGAAAFSMLTTL